MNTVIGVIICYTVTAICVGLGLLVKKKLSLISVWRTLLRLLAVTLAFCSPALFLQDSAMIVFVIYLGMVAVLSGFPLSLFPPALDWALVFDKKSNRVPETD
jgi:hypothetical protein